MKRFRLVIVTPLGTVYGDWRVGDDDRKEMESFIETRNSNPDYDGWTLSIEDETEDVK